MTKPLQERTRTKGRQKSEDEYIDVFFITKCCTECHNFLQDVRSIDEIYKGTI